MKKNKIGILELRDDPFIIDVVSKLGEYCVEFLSFAESAVPISSDYRVIIDRLSFRFPYLKEMVKNLSLDGTYVVNNPFAATTTNKLVDARISQLLGIPSPKSMVIPGPELQEEITGVIAEPSWNRIADEVGFPCFLKPVDGYGWEDVFEVNTPEQLKQCYVSAGAGKIWLVQRKVLFKLYYRVFCINQRDVLFIKWIPKPLGLGEYLYTDLKEIDDIREQLTQQTIQLNSYLDMDINVVEWCVDNNGQAWVIDAFNEVPDMPKSRMPHEYYWWIVDRFVDCIKDKLSSDKRNKHFFSPPASSFL